jgi:hypothetical protein
VNRSPVSAREGLRPNLAAGLLLLVGAIGYALAVGALGLTFNVTPLWFGSFSLAAGLASHQPRLVSIAFPLIGWGTAVLLVSEGPVPRGRTAAAYLVGAGLGMLVASVWAQRNHISTVGAALAVVSGGLGFFLAFDIDALSEWPAWAVLMAVWALVEGIRTHDARRPEAAELDTA